MPPSYFEALSAESDRGPIAEFFEEGFLLLVGHGRNYNIFHFCILFLQIFDQNFVGGKVFQISAVFVDCADELDETFLFYNSVMTVFVKFKKLKFFENLWVRELPRVVKLEKSFRNLYWEASAE